MSIDQTERSDDVNDRISQAEVQICACFLTTVEISMTSWIQNQLWLVTQLSTLVLITPPLTLNLINLKNRLKNHA